MEDDDDHNRTNLHQQTSVDIEEINNQNLLELGDGNDDEEPTLIEEPALIDVDDDEEDEEPEESAEAELGQSWFQYIHIMLMNVQPSF